MTHKILFSSNKASRSVTWLTILGLLAIISLSCDIGFKPREPVSQAEPVEPVEPGKPAGFEKTDCAFMGITFPEITIDYIVDENNAGPILNCNSASQGAHGSVRYSINIVAYQADKLEGIYQEQQASIQRFVDQSTGWNAEPDIPDEAKDEITIIKNDSEGYIFMISSEANVQNCYNGYGYGVEKVNGKYLIHIEYESCELPDAAAYKDVMENLEITAMRAIVRVDAESQP